MKIGRTDRATAYNENVNGARIQRLATVLGPCAALVVAATTASARDEVGAANAGLALAVLVVGAALTGRAPGLATAAAAAVSFNYFHTQPYHSLRIDRAGDVVIVALLAALGLVVSDISAWRRRREARALVGQLARGAPKRLAELLSEPHRTDEVWPALATMIMDQLRFTECHLVAAAPAGLPVIARTESRGRAEEEGLVLPAHGAALPVIAAGTVVGHLILRPRAGLTSVWVERRVVLALADHLAIALTYTGRVREPRAVDGS